MVKNPQDDRFDKALDKLLKTPPKPHVAKTQRRKAKKNARAPSSKKNKPG